MQFLTFLFTAALVYPLSLLPMWVLYRISDLLFILIYHLIGYRRKVVSENLRLSFPERDAQFIKDTERAFYAHLCDLVVETIKSFTISPEEVVRRCQIVDLDKMNDLYDKGYNVILALGHYNNWEWAALSSSIQTKHRLFTVYKSVTNPYIDRMYQRMRQRFGMGLVSMPDVRDFYSKIKRPLFMNCFVMDQSPTDSKRAYWTEFLGRETGFQYGGEKYAREFNQVFVFVDIRKVSRGYYEIRMKCLEENSADSEPYSIMDRYISELEQQVSENPAYWLWSHKRWKRKRSN